MFSVVLSLNYDRQATKSKVYHQNTGIPSMLTHMSLPVGRYLSGQSIRWVSGLG